MSDDEEFWWEALRRGAQRLLVVNDLGEVHKGDHLVVVAGVVVAVDTSRRPDDVVLNRAPQPSPQVKRKQRSVSGEPPPSATRTSINSITTDRVLAIIRQFQPITSLNISDRLQIARSDMSTRSAVTRALAALLMDRQIKKSSDSRVPSYEIAPKTDQETSDPDPDPAILER